MIIIYKIIHGNMKHIIDFYENEIVATPANTSGMGNPMPAADNSTGSEPLVGKKCKKAKCKKEKISEASILGDIDASLNASDEVIEFARWYTTAQLDGKGEAAEDAIAMLLSGLQHTGKNEWTIDMDKQYNYKGKIGRYDPDRLLIPRTGLPKNVKKITFINATYGIFVASYVGDISDFTIEVFKDNHRTFGDLECSFKMAAAGNDIKLGNVTCDAFKINHPKMETLSIKDNTILEVRLDNNPELETVYGRFPNASLVKLSNKLVTHTLAQTGLIPWGCKLQLYN